MYLTNFMTHTGIEQNTFTSCRFTRIDMSTDTDIAITLNWSYSSHDYFLSLGVEKEFCLQQA